MSKKIKKQIRRSMPLFVIVSLIVSTTAIGLVFNLNLQNYFEDSSELSIKPSEVKAQTNDDTATTSVTVMNAQPTFSVAAAEAPSSTSTSPVNVGDAIRFTAQANDPENNDYYLIVCETPGIVASTTGGPPECDDGAGTYFCVSTSTLITNEATCTYGNVADPPGETQEWYAYVCDNHSTQGACSLNYSQGAFPGDGDDSSPFYINHAPVYTALATTDDNKDPGGTFTVTASVTDSDVASSADDLYLYICASNSWATSTGCTDATWCTGTSTTPDITCTFATSTPALDGTFSYYGFVMDEHYFAAAANPRSANYNVNNVAPTVGDVTLNSGVDITLNIKGASEVLSTTTSTTINDNNSCEDIVSATSTIYISTSTLEELCTADDNNCYQITSAFCTRDSSSCTGSSDPDVTYTCSTTIAFHAIPTDVSSGNPNAYKNWRGAIGVTDDDGATGRGTSSSGVEVKTSTALDVTESGIPYGTVAGAADTEAVNSTTTVINYGNSPLDSAMDVTDMLKTDLTNNYIDAVWQEFDLLNFTYGFGSYSIATTAPDQLVDTATAKPTNQTDVSDLILWGIGIPGGTLSGDYTGTTTFQATLDISAW